VLEVVEALAREHGFGEEIELEALGADPHDPYAFLGLPAVDDRPALAPAPAAPRVRSAALTRGA
jgi:hypothetical protein